MTTPPRTSRGGGSVVGSISSRSSSSIRWLVCPFLLLAIVGYLILYSSMDNSQRNNNDNAQNDFLLQIEQPTVLEKDNKESAFPHQPKQFQQIERDVMVSVKEEAYPSLPSNSNENIISSETISTSDAKEEEKQNVKDQASVADEDVRNPEEEREEKEIVLDQDQLNHDKDNDENRGDNKESTPSKNNAEDTNTLELAAKQSEKTTISALEDDNRKDLEEEEENDGGEDKKGKENEEAKETTELEKIDSQFEMLQDELENMKETGADTALFKRVQEQIDFVQNQRDEYVKEHPEEALQKQQQGAKEETLMMKTDQEEEEEGTVASNHDIKHDAILQKPPQQQQQQSTTHHRHPTTTRYIQPPEEDLVKLQECFPLNSKEWLRGPRHGNIDHHQKNNNMTTEEEGLGDDAYDYDKLVAKMILFSGSSSQLEQQQQQQQDTTTKGDDGGVDAVLQRSICLQESRFLNVSDHLTDDRSIQLWIVRLTYMAMHKVQHQFAVEEVQQQRSSLSKDCQQLATKYHIGSFDYECPDGKFFVLPVENLGLGAIMRTNVYSGLLAGLATNRAVLFVNNAPSNTPKPIQPPWYHASCHRFDTQCFFQPPTPCVVTYRELETAVVMNGFRNVTKLFKNPERMMEEEWFNETRTIIIPFKTITRKVTRNIPDILRNYTIEFSNTLDKDDPRQEVLAKVADRFVSSVHRSKVNQLISYGLVFFALRPHLQSQQQLREVLEKVIPSTKAHPEVTLGLPIRASDKCIEESECLTFEQYMRVMGQIWNRHKTNLTKAMKQAAVDKLQIVVTSESASVIQEKDAFLANQSLLKKVPFPFEVVTNDFDIQQDTGNPQFNVPELNLDVVLEKNNADQVMLSMMSSLQTQLMARYSIGNCCSNFHRLLFELLDGGCGAAYQSDPECLHKNEDPEFRICCLWDKREECKERKVREQIEKKWAAVKRRRMAERMRRRQGQQQQEAEEET